MRSIVLLGSLLVTLSSHALGQQVALAERGPRFLIAVAERAEPLAVDVNNTPVLRRRISLDLSQTTLGEALRAVSQQSGLKLVYSRDVVDLHASVRLRADSITVAAALTELLLGAGVDVLLSPAGQAALVRAGPAQVGTVAGRVTDQRSGAGLADASVRIEGIGAGAVTGPDGHYRIVNVPPGSQTVIARRIGYAQRSQIVNVLADGESTTDFALEPTPTKLDQVVVTGTIIPTEVKALPTPVSVVTAEDIERFHIRRVDEAIRLATPGAVVWERGNALGPGSLLSLRGTSGIVAPGSNPKVYVDGIETAFGAFAAVDPQSIERIEVVRGPQAAAIYGSDAMGGVIQVFTKRGAAVARRPEVDGRAELGVIESEFANGGALQQEYDAALHGRGGPASYQLGGGYAHVGDWLPQYGRAAPSVFGSLRTEQGPITFDLSARHYEQTVQTTANPRLVSAWPAVFRPGPFYTPARSFEETYAARLEYRPTSWWEHTLTAGIDHFSSERAQTRPTLLTPGDTLLILGNDDYRKSSFAYHTSLVAHPASGLVASVTAGVDHWSFTSSSYLTFAPKEVGPVPVGSIDRAVGTNTGVLIQGLLNIHETLFLTGGVREEWNTNFGGDVERPVTPRVGATYVRQLGPTTVKLRASYGAAIRPPDRGLAQGSIDEFSIVRANPLLRPERQTGPDMGVDLVFGRRGSLSVTHYRQIAKDLITFVTLDALATPQVYQYQNISRVRNRGWEFEGTLQFGALAASGQYAITSSVPEELGPSYFGDLTVGQQIIGVPQHTAAMTLTAEPFARTTVTGSLAYTGKRQQYDYLAQYRCFGGTGPCTDPTGLYLTDYAAFAKLNLFIEHRFAPAIAVYLGAENVANAGNGTRGQTDLSPLPGRTTTLGARVHF